MSRAQKLFGIGPVGAAISLGLVTMAVVLDGSLGSVAISANTSCLRFVGAGLLALGAGLHFWSMWTLRHWWADDQLCTMGPFRWFRHPMYTAWITFIVPALALFSNSWVFVFVAVLIHPIWHRLVLREETVMLEKFPNDYRAYAERTGRFFPRLWRRSPKKPTP